MLRPAFRAILPALGVTLTAFFSVSAQERDHELSQFYHTAWTTRDGAPADVLALAQTADGFLWLGTQSGLFRFDGIRFELFEPRQPGALPSMGVRSLLALPDGGLWVGYQFGGASLIQGDTVRSFGEPDGLPRGTVMSLVRDSDGRIWAGATGGLARLDRGRWHRVGPDEGLSGAPVVGMLADRSRRIWVAGGDGMFVRAHGASRFERVGQLLHYDRGYRSQTFLQEAPDGSIWSTTPGEAGLRKLATPAGLRRDGAFDPRVPEGGALLIDRSGAFWLGRGASSIERFEADGSKSQRMAQGLSAGTVLTWLEDREGNVWAGTIGGLDQFRRTKLTRVQLPGSRAYLAIAAADSGALWVGSSGSHLLRVGRRIEPFPEVPHIVDVAYRDRQGRVWVGGPLGLWRFNGGRFGSVPLAEVKNTGLQAVTHDGAGNLWISLVGSGVYQRVGDRWVPYGGQEKLPREPAVVLTADEAGRTWFGYTGNRLAVLETGSIRLYTAEDGLTVGIVHAIHVRGPHVWVGGEQGLALLTRGGIRSITGRNGFRFRGTSGVVETPDGEVWLHGAIGITRIPAEEVRRAVEHPGYQVSYELLDFRDGLTGTAAQIRPQPTVIAGTDGRLWFATTVGIAWLDPKAIARNPTPPPIVIRRLTAGNKAYPIDPDVVLPVNTRALRIDYTALSLSIPQRVRFRYQLVGSDSGWQDAGGRREAFYTNLKPGSYRFRVIASNEDGVWNEAGAAFAFSIPPSFTQSRWFLAVWVVVLSGLIWLAYLGRMRQVAGGLQVRYQAALAERTRIAQELHDTLLQGFTGITLQLRAIERMLARQPRESAEALKSVLASADTALRDARHMIWDMRAVELEGRDLADALELATRQALADSSAQFVFNLDGDRRQLPLTVETTALRIGREAVLNAVKHAAPRKVEVSLEYGPRSLTLRVADDGTGIRPGAMDAAAAGEHLGIAGMRDRAQRAGGTLDISSEPGRGTTVTASLPNREPTAAADQHH
jgi:ligand-binding sensor domain-containing protein/signal transduction histidine kinase